MNVDKSSIEIDGVDTKDYPDLCDAYISYAEWEDGTPLTDEELDSLTEKESDLGHELAHEALT